MQTKLIFIVVSLCAIALYPSQFKLASAQTMCTNIPSDHVYYLTSFCDQTTACGPSCGNCMGYYCADKQRFGCNAIINCCRSGSCLNLKVIDAGPACTYEKKAGKPIIDASYSACQKWTGSTSCGWSDRIAVTCVKTSGFMMSHENEVYESMYSGIPLGPCTWNSNEVTESMPFCHHSSMKGLIDQTSFLHEVRADGPSEVFVEKHSADME